MPCKRNVDEARGSDTIRSLRPRQNMKCQETERKRNIKRRHQNEPSIDETMMTYKDKKVKRNVKRHTKIEMSRDEAKTKYQETQLK